MGMGMDSGKGKDTSLSRLSSIVDILDSIPSILSEHTFYIQTLAPTYQSIPHFLGEHTFHIQTLVLTHQSIPFFLGEHTFHIQTLVLTHQSIPSFLGEHTFHIQTLLLTGHSIPSLASTPSGKKVEVGNGSHIYCLVVVGCQIMIQSKHTKCLSKSTKSLPKAQEQVQQKHTKCVLYVYKDVDMQQWTGSMTPNIYEIYTHRERKVCFGE